MANSKLLDTLPFTNLIYNRLDHSPKHMLIEKYTSNWITQFLEIKTEIEQALMGLETQIEHVGSTSVPNLDAKPIIDIDIIYENESEFEKIKSELLKIGYYHNGDQGIKNREVFKQRKSSSKKVLNTITHHLYVCKKHSDPLERHLLMRNFLRKNEWARITYQDMKYQLAEKAQQDKRRYAELKELHVNEFIDDIVEKEKNRLRTIG